MTGKTPCCRHVAGPVSDRRARAGRTESGAIRAAKPAQGPGAFARRVFSLLRKCSVKRFVRISRSILGNPELFQSIIRLGAISAEQRAIPARSRSAYLQFVPFPSTRYALPCSPTERFHGR